jgi:hypothetical protein
MLRKALAGLWFGAFLLSGCSHDNPQLGNGRLIAEYAPAQSADVSKAPYQATYVLRHWPVPPSDPPPKQWIPEEQIVTMYVRGLERRQSVGFEKTADGKLLAVAGEEKISLEMGRYSWHIHPSTEYTGAKWFFHETGERVVEIVSLPFEVAAAAVVLPVVCGAFLFTWPFLLLH